MSQANVEMVKRWVAAFNRRDLDALMETVIPDFAFLPAMADTIDGNSFQRREGMEAYFVDVDSAWEELRVIYDEYRELDDERILVLTHRSARGKTSGLNLGQVRARAAQLFHVRDGQVTRMVTYFDLDRAVADLGLAE